MAGIQLDQIQLPVFRHLVSKGAFRQKHFDPNFVINTRQNYREKIYVILKGAIKIYHQTENGGELIPIILSNNMIFGADCIFGEQDNHFISETLLKTDLLVFNVTDLQDAIAENLVYQQDLLKILNDKYTEAENRIHVLKIRNTELRFVEALLEFNLKFGHECEKNKNYMRIPVPLDQDSFGKYIRVTRETICLLINDFKSKGIISYEKNKFIVAKEIIANWQKKSNLIKRTGSKQNILV